MNLALEISNGYFRLIQAPLVYDATFLDQIKQALNNYSKSLYENFILRWFQYGYKKRKSKRHHE